MKNSASLKSIIVLFSICLFIAVAMAAVNLVTAPMIERQQSEAEQQALSTVLKENGGFDKVELDVLPESVSAVYADKDGEGYVTMLTVKGYDSSKPMSIAVGYTNDGKLEKMTVISAQGETSGIGSKVTLPEFLSQFEGKTESLNGVDAISGATISSSSVKDAVKQGFEAVKLAKEVRAND